MSVDRYSLCGSYLEYDVDGDYVYHDDYQQLERELAGVKAESERLKAELSSLIDEQNRIIDSFESCAKLDAKAREFKQRKEEILNQ